MEEVEEEEDRDGEWWTTDAASTARRREHDDALRCWGTRKKVARRRPMEELDIVSGSAEEAPMRWTTSTYLRRLHRAGGRPPAAPLECMLCRVECMYGIKGK